jgi:hypothetical protein
MAKTTFVNGTVVTSAIMNSIYLTGGGHVHNGGTEDGEAPLVDLVQHVTNSLACTNIVNPIYSNILSGQMYCSDSQNVVLSRYFATTACMLAGEFLNDYIRVDNFPGATVKVLNADLTFARYLDTGLVNPNIHENVQDVINIIEYSGGLVRVTTSGDHRLNTGAWVVIEGTTNYNGVFQITETSYPNLFTVVNTTCTVGTAPEATGTWRLNEINMYVVSFPGTYSGFWVDHSDRSVAAYWGATAYFRRIGTLPLRTPTVLTSNSEIIPFTQHGNFFLLTAMQKIIDNVEFTTEIKNINYIDGLYSKKILTTHYITNANNAVVVISPPNNIIYVNGSTAYFTVETYPVNDYFIIDNSNVGVGNTFVTSYLLGWWDDFIIDWD